MGRKQILGYSIVGLLAVVVWQGVAGAQAPAEEPAAPATAGMAKQVNMSMADQVAQAASHLSRMESIRDSVRRELADARQQRDVVKTLCLNDKLNQLDVAIRSANDRKRSLELAAQRGDQDLTNHEYTILSVLYQRAQQLDAEAKQCIGKEVGFVGESSTTVEVDPGMPAEDPTEYPTPPDLTIPPSCASCYK
ncbi:MAG: hypothetical protein DRI90_16290 [Deltaproteobacteria bacterium]|nr:MAG: hypothetical protein DRI90_16290 [Deltaproteobacteria bacterium]